MLLDCRNCGQRFDTKARLADGDCCSDDCTVLLRRRLLATLPSTPFSMPSTQMHARPAAPTRRAQPIPGLADLEAARPTPKERAHAALRLDRAALAVPPPARPLSVLDAEAAMRTARSPDAITRLLDAHDHGTLLDSEIDDLAIRAKGLVPFNPELEKRRSAAKAGGELETRGRRPDLTGW